MKSIRELKNVQIRIFPADEIYFQGILRTSSIKVILEKYSFKSVPTVPEGIPIPIRVIQFENGEFGYKNKNYLVTRLAIEERRIIIEIEAKSGISDAFFRELHDLLLGLDLRETKPTYKPLLKSEETTCVTELDFSMLEFCKGTTLSQFQEKLVKHTPSHGSKLNAYIRSIRFRIGFLTLPLELKERRITLSDKEFILEVREKTSPEDKIFLSSSPTDTETHIMLLKELEKLISKQTK